MLVNPYGGGKKLPELTNPGSAADLYPGKQLIDANGNILTGAMPVKSAESYTPGVANKVISSGRYLTGDQTILGDTNLKAANIKEGIKIFGVTGTLKSATYPSLSNPGSASDMRSGRQFINQNGEIVTGTMPTKSAQTYTPSRYDQTIQSGYYLTGDQTIEGDYNLIASNIKAGVTIFGVYGTYEPETPEPSSSLAWDVWQGDGGVIGLNITFDSSISSISQIVLTYDGLGDSDVGDIISLVWSYGSSSATAVLANYGARSVTMSTTSSNQNYKIRYVKSGNSLTLFTANSNDTLSWGSANYTVAILGSSN